MRQAGKDGTVVQLFRTPEQPSSRDVEGFGMKPLAVKAIIMPKLLSLPG